MTYFNDKKAFDKKWTAGDDEHEEALAQCGVSVEAAWRIPGRPVRWLVENVIPHDAVTVIAGDAGAGKTFFACQLAADAARVSQCRVVLAASGYEAPELLRWRLDQAEADTRRVVLATLTPHGFKDRRGGPTEEEIDERMAVLYHTLVGAGDPTSGILPKEGSGQCKMQIAKCKLQNDASGSSLDSEDLPPKTQDLSPKTSENEKAEGGRQKAEEISRNAKCKSQKSKWEEGKAEEDGQCKMQIAKCKMQNDASGSSLDSEDVLPKTQDVDLVPKTQDLRPKTSDDDFPPLPELPRAAELLVIDDVDGWFGKPGQCVSAAGLARIIGRLNELARSLHVAIVVLVRAQMSVEGRITSRQLSRLAQSASVVWMVVRDREQGTGQRVELSPKSKVQSPKSENGVEADVHCKMQIANSKLQNDASGSSLDSEGISSKTQDLRPKTSASNPKSKIENPKSDGPAYSQSDRRWLLPVKNNLAPDVETFGRAFELFDGQIRWHRDDPAPDLAEALLPSTHNSDRRRLRHAAAAWLEEALAGGPLPSKELYRQGAENGFSQGTLKRAATELGIHPHKTGFDGGWEMRWTPPPVVRGRGTTATRAGAGFKIFGGDDEVVESEKEKGKSEGEEVDENAAHSSCASSREREEIDAASCASSRALVESEKEKGKSERDEVEENAARSSCASSREREEIDAASCASSGKQCKMQNAKCKTQNDASGSNLDPEIGGHKVHDPKPTTSGGEIPSSGGCNVYTAIGDALPEACFKSAS